MWDNIRQRMVRVTEGPSPHGSGTEPAASQIPPSQVGTGNPPRPRVRGATDWGWIVDDSSDDSGDEGNHGHPPCGGAPNGVTPPESTDTRSAELEGVLIAALQRITQRPATYPPPPVLLGATGPPRPGSRRSRAPVPPAPPNMPSVA